MFEAGANALLINIHDFIRKQVTPEQWYMNFKAWEF